MGHRKKHAPRRGSLAYRPRGRARSLVPRVRYWRSSDETKILGFSGYKAGMTYGYIVEDNTKSPYHGQEIFCPLTVIDTPPIWICAIRAYESTDRGLKSFAEAWAKDLPKDLDRATMLPGKEATPTDKALSKIEKELDRIAELRAIVCTLPRDAGIHKKKPDIMEIPVGGSSAKEKLDYLKGILGKKVQVSDIFSEGQYVDVIAVSKGKGFTGPVKRFGIRILQDKSRKTVRGVGCIGPWNPTLVTSTVPRAGQQGFSQRVEFNLRIVKIGSDGKEITPKNGFLRYGVVKGAYLIVRGSIPGPAKRLIRIRYAVRKTEEAKAVSLTTIRI
jgi:large subunit ribosomal protein L3